MKKNKGLFGGLLEFGGNMIGKVMDVTLSIAIQKSTPPS